MIKNNADFKYKTPYKGPFEITPCWTNGTVKLQCGAIKARYNICYIKQYTYDKNVEDIKY